MPTDRACRVAVTPIQGGPEELGHPTRETDRTPRRGRRHLVGAPQQVVEARLVPGVGERVVGRPAVVDHGAAVVDPEDDVRAMRYVLHLCVNDIESHAVLRFEDLSAADLLPPNRCPPVEFRVQKSPAASQRRGRRFFRPVLDLRTPVG
jgi:hypothetical protein